MATNKEVAFEGEAFKKMLVGFNKASKAVMGTIGPKGRNVYLDDPIQPKIVNDGATIANKIYLKDKQEDAGAYVIRNVSSQQVDDVGDGTTTVTVLTHALVHECLKRPENAMLIKHSLKQAGQKMLKALAKTSQVLKPTEVYKVALISSEDTIIAKLITEIIEKLGKEAIVNVEDSKTFATEYEIMDGYEAHVGFLSPHFVTDKKSGKAVYSDVPVLVSERKLSNVSDIKPIFEMFQKAGINQCVLVVDDIDDSILGILVQNKLMGTFNALVVKATTWLASDIAGATGATIISNATGVSFGNFKKEYLGTAKKVVCTANTTLFTTNGVAAKTYAALLDSQAASDPNMFSSKKIKERAAKMRGGVAILKIGASTDFEREYLRLKAEDSVKAVQAALAEGIVEGGGMALWRLAQAMQPKTIGEEILKKAMQAPLRQIITNAGKDYTEIVAGLNGEGFSKIGYNAKDDKMVNLIEWGIIDPTKVERCALENAVSAASTFITTFATITEVGEDK